MEKVWKANILKYIGIVLISASLGFYYSKLRDIEFVLENADAKTLQELINVSLIPDIKFLKIIGYIVFTITIGMYFKYVLYKNNNDTENKIT